MEFGYSYYFFSGADIRWWFLIWDDNNLGIQLDTRIWYFVLLFLFLFFVYRLFDKLTGFFFLSVVFFFFNTKKALFFLFYSFFFLETESPWLIQLLAAGILCWGVKIRGNILLVTYLIFVSIYVWFTWMCAADVLGCMYFELWCDFCRPWAKQTGITPDTICYTIHFWGEF